ncbi:DUF1524 domain-containing protein [Tessaracoccus antarcticus]|uniref:DUF1524 domain-containing protein n=1 Tax=Tessaracoccus antarcticus TaxID=2479848 RepID=A0A3M0GIG9_9ACTN|nr:DUF1524 domain-containing protein [Tessaracoccus antarcticus]
MLGAIAVAVLVIGFGGTTASSTVDAPASASSATSDPTVSRASSPAEPSAAHTTATVSVDGSAMAALSGLEIKGRAPRTGYSRDRFGAAWADVDRNGCDTRNDILRRDLMDARTRPGSNGCAVARGTLADPYTGTTIAFIRGSATSQDIHVDHVVALSDAWQKGAQQWDQATLTHFANDPLNLLAVAGTANMQKGDGDAATWLPPNKSYRCDYVARQVAVKARYGLWVTGAEYAAIEDILQRCPGKDLVTSAEPPRTDDSIDAVAAPEGTAPSTPASTTVSSPAATGTPAEDVYYENCAAAREAGAAPLLRGEPGYRSAMDGDDDGIACE